MCVGAYGEMEFAAKLEKVIALSGKSQSAIARETGINQSAISAMTRGERRPYMDQALLLARATNVSLDYLADNAQEEPPPVSEPSELERAVIDLVHALGLDKQEALRRLAMPSGQPILTLPGARPVEITQGSTEGTNPKRGAR